MNQINLIVSSSVGETWLDLYEEQPLQYTFNLEDIISVEPKSEFSRGFRIPGTDKNYNFFTTLFDISGTDFNPGQKYQCRINIDGSDFREGELRLQKVYRNDVTGKLDYECVFLSSAKSLASAVGETTLNMLDWNDYQLFIDLDEIETSWSASAFTTDGLQDGNLVFPIIDFGNRYETSNAGDFSEVSVGGAKSFDDSNNPYSYRGFRPMVRLQEVMRRIFEQNGFKIKGEFLTGNTDIKKIYVSAFGNKDEATVSTVDGNLAQWNGGNGFNLSNDGAQTMPLPFASQDDGNNLIDGLQYGPGVFDQIYVVPETAAIVYEYYIPLQIEHEANESATWVVRIFEPDSTVARYIRISVSVGSGACAGSPSRFIVEESTDNLNWTLVEDRCGNEADGFYDGEGNVADVYVYQYSIVREVQANATAGQYIVSPQWSAAQGNEPGSFGRLLGGAYAAVTALNGPYSVGNKFRDDYKVVDFIKDVFRMFRLIMIPDPVETDAFIITPWRDYIGKGVVKNWSNKINKDKDYVIRPLILDQTDRFTLKFASDGDFYNTENEAIQGEVYGTKKLDSVYDVLKGETVLETKCATTPASRIRGDVNNNWDFLVPQMYTVESEDTFNKYLPIVPKTRLLYYDGLEDIDGGESYFLRDIDASSREYTEFPAVSVFSQNPNGGPNNKAITFERETSFGSGLLTSQGQDLYSLYWSPYLELIYNRDARRVTAYFTLTADDILNFRYDDVIFVEGVYYYVEKIYDAPLGQDGKVKVDLITLKNYRPKVTIPDDPEDQLWEDVDTNWDDLTTLWENV